MDKNNDLYEHDNLLSIITCSKQRLSVNEESNLKELLLKPEFDLQSLIELAHSHGVLPLVHKTVKHLAQQEEATGSQTHISRKHLSELKKHYLYIAQKNIQMSAELLRIMALFHHNGIKAIAFKGPTLAQLAYGDITQRQFSDLDILVSEKQLFKAAQLITREAYTPMDSIEYLKNSAKLKIEKNYEFYGIKNDIKVEIHWQLINSSFIKKFKDYDLFSTQQELKINGTSLPVLPSNILLIYLCNHGASHMWERLEWIVDIDRLLKQESSNLILNEVIALASTLQSKTPLLLGLALAQKLLHTTLPSDISDKLSTDHITVLVDAVLETYQNETRTEDHTSHTKNLKVFNFHLSLQDTLGSKTRYVLQTLFAYSDRDVMALNLPRQLHFLYYPLRILRIINKYTFLPIKHLFSKKGHPDRTESQE